MLKILSRLLKILFIVIGIQDSEAFFCVEA